jgi:hypothetical protein
MCPADITPDGGPSDETSSADATSSGGTPVAASGVVQVFDEDRAPDYPPAQLVLSIPIDGEPYILEDGGLPDWLIAAGMARILDTIRQAEQSDTWDLSSNCDTEEDE